jgi:hypothetical protein
MNETPRATVNTLIRRGTKSRYITSGSKRSAGTGDYDYFRLWVTIEIHQ